MKKLVGGIVTVSTLIAAGFVIYHYGLSEEAKEGLKKACSTIKEAYEKVSEAVAAAQGEVMVDDAPLPNVQATAQQWANLGY